MYIFLRFLFIASQIILILGLTSIASAQDFPPDNWQGGAEGGWYVNVDENDTLNIRSLPKYKSAKVGELNRGIEVNILDSADNGWKFVDSKGYSGWVNGVYLSSQPVKVNSLEGQKSENQFNFKEKYEIVESIKTTPDTSFEIEFEKYKQFFRGNDKCYSALKRRSELVGYSMQIEQNDPVAFRNLKAKYDECVGTINVEKLDQLESRVKELAVSDNQKTRFSNFTREYTEIIEDAVGLLQIGQMLGISFE
jgi:uncharacterized protein YgiM (DUF1202 family)